MPRCHAVTASAPPLHITGDSDGGEGDQLAVKTGNSDINHAKVISLPWAKGWSWIDFIRSKL